MNKIEIGKVENLSAWNENFRAEISDFFSFFAERKLSLRTLGTVTRVGVSAFIIMIWWRNYLSLG